jgi:hypothetical protein
MSYSDLATETSAAGRGRIRITTAAGVVVMLLCACLAAAVLGSGPLLDWADDVSDRTGVAGLHDAAQAWHDGLQKLGLTKPYTSVRDKVRAAEQTEFEAPIHD